MKTAIGAVRAEQGAIRCVRRVHEETPPLQADRPETIEAALGRTEEITGLEEREPLDRERARST